MDTVYNKEQNKMDIVKEKEKIVSQIKKLEAKIWKKPGPKPKEILSDKICICEYGDENHNEISLETIRYELGKYCNKHNLSKRFHEIFNSVVIEPKFDYDYNEPCGFRIFITAEGLMEQREKEIENWKEYKKNYLKHKNNYPTIYADYEENIKKLAQLEKIEKQISKYQGE